MQSSHFDMQDCVLFTINMQMHAHRVSKKREMHRTFSSNTHTHTHQRETNNKRDTHKSTYCIKTFEKKRAFI